MQRSMHVVKRDGQKEPVSFDKVLRRIQKASRGLAVHPDALAQRVLSQIFDGVKTTDLDELAAQLAASLSTQHPDYATLASSLTVSSTWSRRSCSTPTHRATPTFCTIGEQRSALRSPDISEVRAAVRSGRGRCLGSKRPPIAPPSRPPGRPATPAFQPVRTG